MISVQDGEREADEVTILAAVQHTSLRVYGSPSQHPSYCRGCKAEKALARLVVERDAAERERDGLLKALRVEHPGHRQMGSYCLRPDKCATCVVLAGFASTTADAEAAASQEVKP